MVRTVLKEAASTALYGFHACIHPFEGFYNIKHFRKRNGLAALFVLFAVVIAVVLKLQCTGFLFQIGNPEDNNIFLEILLVVAPICIWSVVNWSMTTLFEGKATMKNIFITTVFALLPLVIIYLPQVLLSHFFTLDESAFISILDAIALIWSIWLLLAGLASVQDYTMFKTILTSVFTILAIVALLFLASVFYSSLQQLVSFFTTIFSELTYWIQ